MPEPLDEALTTSLLLDVLAERRRQHARWGEQNHPPGKWSLILAEELGEAAKAAVEGEWGAYRTEMVQAVAVAVQMLESLYRRQQRLLDMSGTRHLDESSLLPLVITLPLPNFESVIDVAEERLVGQKVLLSDGTGEPRTAYIHQATLLDGELLGLVLNDVPPQP